MPIYTTMKMEMNVKKEVINLHENFYYINRAMEDQIKQYIGNSDSLYETYYTVGFLLGIAKCYTYNSLEYKTVFDFLRRRELIYEREHNNERKGKQ